MTGDLAETRLQAALAGQAAATEADLSVLLSEYQQISAWRSRGLPEDVATYLGVRADELARRIADLLASWRQGGGAVRLAAAGSAPTWAAPPPPLAPPPTPPAPPVEVRPPPPMPSATNQALASLKTHLEGSATRPIPMPVDWMPRLKAIVAGLQPGVDDETELARLFEAAGKIEVWTGFPADVQRMLLGLFGTRLRTLQDEHDVRDRRLDQTFSILTAYSARERPGAVRGLARSQTPLRESWADDAESWWERLSALVPAPPAPTQDKLLDRVEALAQEIDRAPAAAAPAVRSQTLRVIRAAMAGGVPAKHPRLVRLATPLVEHLTGKEFRQLRREIREDAEAAIPEDETAVVSQIPADWRWRSRTNGRIALMIGGSPREERRASIERAFNFKSLEWEPAEQRRNSLMSVKNRVKAGTVDLVIVLGAFVGHDADDIILPACREMDVDWVHVDHGYGVVRIQSAIERFLDPDPTP